jgi:DNA-binding transcriptional ArsR family regulator
MTNYVIRNGKRIEIGTLPMVKTKKQRDKEPYVGCPLTWMRRVRKVLRGIDQGYVAIWLHRRRVVSRKDLFPVSNQELDLELGINRKAKYQTLRKLEKAGAIEIVRDGKRAIQVRILW